MSRLQGLTPDGLKVAMGIKDSYRTGQPICLPGHDARILTPENLLNHDLHLDGFEDPLPLAMVAARDPESPMALAAAARMSPLAGREPLVAGVFAIMGEKTKHPLVRSCVDLVTEHDFNPLAIAELRRRANGIIVTTRQQYTQALRQNLRALLDGTVAPREFVREFFELTEAGNLRADIRKKLVLSLLLSENVRPSVKFLFLENFARFPRAVRLAIISAVLKAEPGHHIQMIRDELRWMVAQGRMQKKAH
ncbi:MAG: hypothetical protein H6907_20530 [Hyphomicrobiales bacterium]|nr:hypothetical protein [Hyphomicrobiales bacterium]MCP5374129.1 hypothetical protein [Hyphomicrobiales bacterium]